MKRSRSAVVGAIVLALVVALPGSAAVFASTPAAGAPSASAARLPLFFEANRGQAPTQFQFLAHGPGFDLFLSASEALLRLFAPAAATASSRSVAGHPLQTGPVCPMLGFLARRTSTVRLRLEGAAPGTASVGLRRLGGVVNYLRGSNPRRWKRHIPTFSAVRFHDVYPGIDIQYYFKQGHLEYDWLISPGANPGAIKLRLVGAQRLMLDGRGALHAQSSLGDVVQPRPHIVQRIAGKLRTIAGRFVLTGRNRVGFTLGLYDRHAALTIDPALIYSTYLAGSNFDVGESIKVDSSGSTFVTGTTSSFDFPTARPFQPCNHGATDVFVTRLNSSGNGLIYSTYIGGSDSDQGMGLALDRSGDAYVTGSTCSPDFPVVRPLQATLHGTCNSDFPTPDAFLLKISPPGDQLLFSTYLGGSGSDVGRRVALDQAGNANVTGYTSSTDFPLRSAFQPTYGGGQNDAFVTKVNATGTTMIFSTYLGGSGDDQGFSIAVDGSGYTYVTGRTNSTNFPILRALQSFNRGGYDAFVTKLNPFGTALLYGTYLGGSADEAGNGIAVDGGGNAYITGQTMSTNFPVVNPYQAANAGGNDVFISKLNVFGSGLAFSTYLGGTGDDRANDIALDSQNNAYITGSTSSFNFPTVQPIQANQKGGESTDVIVAKLSAGGNSLLFSSYLGGPGSDNGFGIALDPQSSIYLTGRAGPSFPTMNAFQSSPNRGSHAFVSKIRLAQSVGVSGSYSGQYAVMPGNGGCPPTCLVTGSGSGSSSFAGPSNLNFSYTASYPGSSPLGCASVVGRMTFVPQGDSSQLFAQISGTTCTDSTNQYVHSEQGQLSFNGGTGRFVGARGNAQYGGTRSCHPSTCAGNDNLHVFRFTFSNGYLSLP